MYLYTTAYILTHIHAHIHAHILHALFNLKKTHRFIDANACTSLYTSVYLSTHIRAWHMHTLTRNIRKRKHVSTYSMIQKSPTTFKKALLSKNNNNNK